MYEKEDKEHYGENVIIAKINWKPNVVTFTNTTSKVLHDFHLQYEKDDSTSEKMRVIETAAKLMLNLQGLLPNI